MTPMDEIPNVPENLFRDKINLETSRINWHELQPFFARGQVVYVKRNLDLIDVAASISADDKTAVDQWMNSGELGGIQDNTALAWYEENKEFWAVVVRPWVLVQDYE